MRYRMILPLALLVLWACQETIVSVPAVETLTVSHTDATLYKNDEVQLTVSFRDSDGRTLRGRSVQWSVDDTTVATVSSEGLITAVGVGATIVRVTAEGITELVEISVPNRPPTAVILAPSQDTVVMLTDTVTLSASANDPDDGPLGGSQLRWNSSLDGDLGTGTTLRTGDLSAGAHTIQLIATDADGATTGHSVGLTVDGPPRLVAISHSPDSLDTSSSHDTVSIRIEATDETSFSYASVELLSPGGGLSRGCWATATGMASGALECPIVMPWGSEAGEWTIRRVQLGDDLGNLRTYFLDELTALGSDLTVTVTTEGWPPPELISYTHSPDTVDVTTEPRAVVFSMQATDSDGVDWGQITITSPSGDINDVCLGDGGGATTVTVECTLTVPVGAPAGDWRVQIRIGDQTGVVLWEPWLAGSITVISGTADSD